MTVDQLCRNVFGLTLGLLALSLAAEAQRGGGGRLEGPFRGIATSAGIESGLYQIESTGVSTVKMREAAEAFLGALDAEQRERCTFAIDDDEWRLWDNRHSPKRQGVGFDEMSEAQREKAFGLLSSGLSPEGIQDAKDIMKLNGTLAELADNFDEYGEWLYWITVMGEPSESEPWGWQLDGHHLVINYFVLGDQVVMSPVFMGSEPVEALGGRFEGTRVMEVEERKGLALARGLTEEQREKAVLNPDKDRNYNLTEAYKDNVTLDYAGVSAFGFDEAQQKLLLDCIETYVGRMRPEHAAIRMAEIKAHLDRTFFAWVGGMEDDSVYYYRIQSPVLLIEFDHQSRVAPFRTRESTREHIHTVLRTPNGNDYGKDLLRQHYEAHPH